MREQGDWKRAGFRDRRLFNQTGRAAEIRLARLAADHHAPQADYSVATGGRPGVDKKRLWDDFREWCDEGQWPQGASNSASAT